MIPADQARYLPGRVLAFFAGIASTPSAKTVAAKR
jgi:hypothetical protein